MDGSLFPLLDLYVIGNSNRFQLMDTKVLYRKTKIALQCKLLFSIARCTTSAVAREVRALQISTVHHFHNGRMEEGKKPGFSPKCQKRVVKIQRTSIEQLLLCLSVYQGFDREMSLEFCGCMVSKLVPHLVRGSNP